MVYVCRRISFHPKKNNSIMAKVNSMMCAEAICADARIGVQKKFMGLSTSTVYKATSSPLKGYRKEYSPTDGERILAVLRRPISALKPQELEGLAETPMGHYLLEMCLSVDKNFIALQLYRFVNLHFEPASELMIYEGGEAHTMASLFT